MGGCNIEYDKYDHAKRIAIVKPPFARNTLECFVRNGEIVVPGDVKRIIFYVSEHPDSSFVADQIPEALIHAILGQYDLFRVRFKLHDILYDILYSGYSSGGSLAEIGNYLEDLYRRAKKDPILEKFIRDYILWVGAKIIEYIKDELSPIISSIEEAVDDFFDQLTVKFSGEDRDKIEEIYEEYDSKLDELRKYIENAWKHLSDAWLNKDAEAIINTLKNDVEEIDTMLYNLPGDFTIDFYVKGAIDKIADKIMNILKANNRDKLVSSSI